MNLEFLLIDVFTVSAFGGSRLYLFPDGQDVPVPMMQKLAMELGAGETAFIIPNGDERPDQLALRVFTPAAEIPFGGHSVLGATFALDQLHRRPLAAADTFTWYLEAGHYRVSSRDEGQGMIYRLHHDDPVFMGQYFHRAKVASALGISEEEIAVTGLPCEVISTGLPIHIVPLGSLEAMSRINLRHRDADAIAEDLGFGDLFVFTCEAVGAGVTVHCRMFAPHFGIPEDAASGAATGALIAYMVKHRLVKHAPQVSIVSEQGLEMGRPSRIVADAVITEDLMARSIRVGGQCILVGRGHITIPEQGED